MTTSPRKKSQKTPTKRKKSASKSVSKSPSKGSTTATAPEPKQKQSRRPRQCLKCPDRPLCTALQCVHSKAYKDLCKSVTAAGITIPNDTVPATVLQLLLDQQRNPSASISSPVPNAGTALPDTGPPPFSIQEQGASLYPVGPSNLHGASGSSSSGPSGSEYFSQSTTLAGANQSPALAFPGVSVEGSGPSQPAPSNMLSTAQQSAILHPQLAQRDSVYSVPSTPSRRQSPPPFLPGSSESNNLFTQSPFTLANSLIDPELLTLSSSTSVTPGGSDDSPFPRSRSAGRLRASEHSPIFGFVDGAGKGQKEWRVVREQPLPPALERSAESTRAYRRRIATIIRRCERISAETGCWLYLAALHPNSHEQFSHYTSQRLEAERTLASLDDLHGSATTMFEILQRSGREGAQKLTATLQRTEATLKRVQEDNDELRIEKDRLEKETREKDELINRLRSFQPTT
ncbi:hypothetical protein BDP27DRAFT_1415363 [Rhodocollybia butyracea]|uniref:Uncharacterized protein n=1 Tax=Rhodocollybia butyracea TaxID=206335 RepID=A0A9P5UDW0_9AGAR|nr:hypothetical protein BDP27DRAFT_1488838 [Rhodocollybia butyracea]KAF9075586.1 hypothetical protein BDP27DRAFT_1415363 [Rhodocollybia butyracea]